MQNILDLALTNGKVVVGELITDIPADFSELVSANHDIVEETQTEEELPEALLLLRYGVILCGEILLCDVLVDLLHVTVEV